MKKIGRHKCNLKFITIQLHFICFHSCWRAHFAVVLGEKWPMNVFEVQLLWDDIFTTKDSLPTIQNKNIIV